MAQLRAQRLQQEMLSHEMQQCTFTPRTNSRQPFRVVSDPEAFYERTQKWRESKEAQLMVRKQQAVEHQLEDCTFRPTPVARRRSSAARTSAELREGSADARVGRAPSDGDGAAEEGSFVDRLYRPQRAQELEAAARDARAALAAEEQKHCPFAPKMNAPYRPRGSERAVGSRYQRPRPAATANHGERFTFTPAVNQLPRRLSKGAAKYLESPAYERLSSMVSRGARRKEQLVEGEGKEQLKQRALTRSLSLGSLRTRQPSHPHDVPPAAPAAPGAAPGAARGAAISAGAPPAVPSATMSSRVATDPPGAGCAPRAFSNSPAFSSYLERLAQYQARKVESERQRTEDAEREQASLSRLTLSRGTRALMARAEAAAKSTGEGKEKGKESLLHGSLLHGSFLERAERAAERRPSPQSAQFTFTPRINPDARERRARSVAELSVGEAARRERVLAAKREEAERHQLDALTFRPALKPLPGVESRLKVSSDPDSYVMRVRQHYELKDKVTTCLREAEEARQMKECTFQPRTLRAPKYVSQIARSMALARQARGPPPVLKPEWR